MPTKNAQPDMDKVHDATAQAGAALEEQRIERIEARDNPPAVHLAWSNVQAEVRSLAKTQTNTTPGQNYKFRGIDAVMNAVGPILRQHKVTIMPYEVDVERRDVTTSQGKASRETTVLVTYRVTGPAGDHLFGKAPGEAMDFGDKGTAKAMSVAYRVFLLQALTLPTDDTDPDAETFERGTDLTPAQKVANGLPGAATSTQIEGVRTWSETRNLMGELVLDDTGNQVPLANLFAVHEKRIAGKEAKVAESTGGNVAKDAETVGVPVGQP